MQGLSIHKDPASRKGTAALLRDGLSGSFLRRYNTLLILLSDAPGHDSVEMFLTYFAIFNKDILQK